MCLFHFQTSSSPSSDLDKPLSPFPLQPLPPVGGRVSRSSSVNELPKNEKIRMDRMTFKAELDKVRAQAAQGMMPGANAKEEVSMFFTHHRFFLFLFLLSLFLSLFLSSSFEISAAV